MAVQRWRRLGALALGAALMAAACGDDSDSGSSSGAKLDAPGDGKVKCTNVSLAFFGALTGGAANLGINIKNGAQLAIDSFNDKNKDCQVKLVEKDSQGDKAQAPALAKSVVDDKSILGVIGPAFSGESNAANPIFNDAGVPIITPSATNPTLSTQKWGIFHRILGNDNDQGPAAATYISGTLKAAKVFVIDDGTDYGKGLADIVKSKLGAAVIGTDKTQEKQTDFAAVVTKVKAAAPDAIFYGGYYGEAGPLTKQLRDAGVKATFVAGDGVKDPGYVEAAGKTAAEGAILTCPCQPVEKYSKDFIDAYKKIAKGQEPQTYSAEAYDAANVFLEALVAGKTDRKAINDFIGTYDKPGITKQIKFDAAGEVTDKSVYAYTVKAGAIVYAAGPIK
ncbi:MAG: branched-chain amino acid ABC transporter substrate-binding protein [Acidimicrobiia bacterium]